MSMKKIQDILLETTAKYQEKSKLNVRFWNQDLNTAELRFIITRDNFPLSLSSENVKVIIALENGENFISSEDFIIDTEVEGVARFTIPDDFMSVANGTVTGQVYVGTLDNDEVVVERQFTFEVENDLLSTIPSELKLQYIKTFADLQNNVADSIKDLQEDMGDLRNHVDNVNQATQNGIAALNNLIQQKENDYNANHTAKMKEINDTGSKYSAKFDDDKQYIDEKSEAFKQSVNGSGLITKGQSEDWQKVKITNDDGTTPLFSNFDFNNPDYALTKTPGTYYVRGGLNSSANGISSNYGYLTISKTYSNSSVAELIYRPIGTASLNNGEIYTCRKNTEWGSWTFVSVDPNKTETVTGSQNKANTAENNANGYTDTKVSSQHSVLFSGSVNGVNNTVNLTGSMNDYEYIIISGDCAGNDFSQIVVPSITGSIVNMQNLNLRDTDGMLLGAYEVRLEITSTTIKITNDVAYDNSSDTGSGPNRNAYTIVRVEGVHKK